jgi:hypothetical protein
MATGNHFWLDCLAGMALAVVAMTIVYRGRLIVELLTGRRADAETAA